MKFFGWMQNKLNGKQGSCSKSNTVSATYHVKQEPREEFSDWPHGLLAIGTFGNNDLKGNPQSEDTIQQGPSDIRDSELSSSDDLQEFSIEEVGKLQKELTKLLSRKPNSDAKKEVASLPLDRFLNCPSSLEVDRRFSSAVCSDSGDRTEEDIDRTISVILGRCKDMCGEDDKRKAIGKKSISFLLKRMFVCSSGFSPAPSLRDTLQESRMEKLLRVMLHKKIYNQNPNRAPSAKKYLEDKQTPKRQKKPDEPQERKSEDGGKWVKTDSESLAQLDFIFFFEVHLLDASVHEYNGVKFVSKGNAFVVHGGSEGIYSSLADPQNLTSTIGDSYIRFEKVTFRRPKESANASSKPIQAVLFEVEDRESIGGSAYGGQRAVCCTADLAKLGVCLEGEVIYRPSAISPNWPKVFGVSFNGDEEAATLRYRSIKVTKTGMYNLYFIHCDVTLKDLTVDGKTVWKNPTGYLPGRMAPLMSFYMFMSLAFVILGIFWFSQYARFWREVLPLQNCITLVITLGMLEMALWYFDYAEFNESGIRPVGITIWAVTFGTIKRTVSRIVILMVSMGYGVVRPTLGGLTSKVIMLGATFFLASEVLELVENVGAVSDLSGKARLFLVLPVAILDAFFILWIFTSLSATLNKLQARRMMVKLDIYRKFTNALAVAVIVSVGWMCYELYFKSNDVYNEQWQNAWIIPAFWQVLSFAMLCVICVLWAPSQNSTRYTYSNDANEDFDKDDTDLTLIKPSPTPSKDFRSAAEARPAQGGNGASNGDLEEDKTE
ncbi:hypothetical protein V6N11_048722 [Hibiscus sabdariffa]|uniref:GOST seven transmembrane domain-containing protein n=1 Tax=Hibiscus sabdariffa TaxID=183260 RepID=A0ABR2PW38_9ROSI